MIRPITTRLSKSILESIEVDKIIYAEVTSPGGMGNAGGTMIYLRPSNTNEMFLYEASIYDDHEAYGMADEMLFTHADKTNKHSTKEPKYFDLYDGGMGNAVFINKKAMLMVRENFFVYTTNDVRFQIFSSVQGVFDSVVRKMNAIRSTETSSMRRISPQWIDRLQENEIFVFGSNLAGLHGGGAAAVARKWGAIWGQGVGLQGQTYAIPTMQGGVETIQPYVDEFLAFAQSNPSSKFLVTEIGCGIAGFTVEQIAPLFMPALDQNMENVFLPASFYTVLMHDSDLNP